MKNKIFSALWIVLCLALVSIGTASADVPMVTGDFSMLLDQAELVQGLALLDGSAAYVSIWQGMYGVYYLDLVAIGEYSETDSTSYQLHGESPKAVQVSACGNNVHVFVETEEHVEYYRFGVGIPIASCRDYPMYFPMVVGE